MGHNGHFLYEMDKVFLWPREEFPVGYLLLSKYHSGQLHMVVVVVMTYSDII